MFSQKRERYNAYCVNPTKELYRSMSIRSWVLGWKFYAPKSATMEGCHPIPEAVMGPRFIGSFRVLAWVGKVSYWLDLPKKLSQIHNIFHVSQPRKCLADESAVVPLNDI